MRKRILVIVGLILFLMSILLSDPLEVWKLLKNVDLIFLIGAMISIILSFTFQTIRFRMFLSNFSRPGPFFSTFQIVVSSAIANVFFPGAGGDIIVRPFILKKVQGKEVERSFLCVLIERIMDFFGQLTLAMVAIFFLLPEYMVYILLVLLAGIIAVFVLFFFPTGYLPFRIPGFIERIIDILRESKKIRIRHLIIGPVLTVLNISFLVCTVTLVIISLNIVPEIEVIGLYFISLFIGIISLIPGGLGTMEGSIAGLFHLVGRESSEGVSILILTRFVLLFVSFVFCLKILPELRSIKQISKKKLKKDVRL
jgi:hypothetical protein